MGLLSFLGGGKVVDTIGDVAKEWIQTDMESAEAKSLFVKTLDPNGKMRKQISEDVTTMYKAYIFMAVFLLFARSFGIGNTEGVSDALDSITELFVPITSMFTAIVAASFGVNTMNSYKGK